MEAFKFSGGTKKIQNLTNTIFPKNIKSKDLEKTFFKEMHSKWNPIYKRIITMKNFSIKIDEIESYF